MLILSLSTKDGRNEHRYVEEQLSAYLDGELVARERLLVEQHLAECPACQWKLDTLRQTVQWAQELPTVSIPRVFTVPVPPEPARAPRWGWMTPLMQGATALVAVLLVFVVAGDLLLTRTLPGSSVMPAAMRQEAPADVVMAPAAPEPTQPAMLGEAPATVVETVVLELEAPLAAEVPEAEIEITEPVEEALASQPEEAEAPAGEAAEGLPTTDAEMRAMTAPTFGTPTQEGLGGGAGEEATQAEDEAEAAVEAAPPLEPTPAPLGTSALEPAPATLQVEPPPAVEPTQAVAKSATQATPTLIARFEEDQPAPESPGEGDLDYDPLAVGFRVAEAVLLIILITLATVTVALMVQRRRARR